MRPIHGGSQHERRSAEFGNRDPKRSDAEIQSVRSLEQEAMETGRNAGGNLR